MSEPGNAKLLNDVDPERDHVRGGGADGRVASVVYYGDFLCPYCRRLRQVLLRLRASFGDRFTYTFRHFPNERAHPGANFMARAAEAAAEQGRFWDMYDALFDREPPISEKDARELARNLGLDMARFDSDLDSEAVRARVEDDLADAGRNGVSGTPTIFVDGIRYDGAWDYYSLLDVLERPVGERIQRSARAFASLPASGGLVLILAAIAALILANSPFASSYYAFIRTPFGIGPSGSLLSLTVGEWFSEGLLAFFFLLVGLEIRRELTAGALTDRKAATLPVVAAVVASITPALIYLLINYGGAETGWSVPTATDIAFALGVLALLGDRVPPSLRVFVAAFAVVDDIVSVLVLAIFYPRNFEAAWLIAALAAIGVMYALNRSRIYATWPYAIVSVAVWFFLHSAGVHGALAGIALAAFLPTRPAPAAAPLLAQAATALAALEHAQSDKDVDDNPVLEWASRNLSAASERLLSPADRIEQAVAPWSTYLILPLFAFSATGVDLNVDVSAPGAVRILAGVILGLVIGKPLGVCTAAWATTRLHIARMPDGAGLRTFVGAACLCGIGDTVSLLLADQAFPAAPAEASIAKIGVLIGSLLSAALGASIILIGSNAPARTDAASAA
jgi:NhaA family Na+:H+ antiporter